MNLQSRGVHHMLSATDAQILFEARAQHFDHFGPLCSLVTKSGNFARVRIYLVDR